MEYTAEIYLKRYLENGTTTGWHNPTTFHVNSDSLEGAIKATEQESARMFPGSLIHINRVVDSTQKVLYDTAWDELGPLVSAFV